MGGWGLIFCSFLSFSNQHKCFQCSYPDYIIKLYFKTILLGGGLYLEEGDMSSPEFRPFIQDFYIRNKRILLYQMLLMLLELKVYIDVNKNVNSYCTVNSAVRQEIT